MKAIVYPKYGGIPALQLQEVPKPTPKDDEALVKVYAVSINDWDWGNMDGSSIMTRLMGGLSKPRIQILGSDIAGIVESVGKNVTSFKPGDAVYGDLSGRWGGFAEYVAAPAKSLAIKPVEMSFEQAAAIPQAGMLAIQGLIDKGEISEGKKLLVNGAGGGVGCFAIQIAKEFGLEVTGVDSTAKLDMLRSLGYDHVIDYTKEDFTRAGKKYDLVLDTKTFHSVFDYLPVLNPNGIYVTVGGSIPRILQLLIVAPFVRRFRKKHLRLVVLKPNKDLEYVNERFVKGKFTPQIDGSFTLEETPRAFEIFARAEHKGKLVITIHRD